MEMNKEKEIKQAGLSGWALVGSALLVGGLGALIAFDLCQTPEVYMAIVIVLAIAVLMVLLLIMASSFARLNLANAQRAMGLPEGSIRAIIAISLIMVFISFGIYLFNEVADPGETITLMGLTEAQRNEIPTENILSDVEHTTYDVKIRSDPPKGKVTKTVTGLTEAQLFQFPEGLIADKRVPHTTYDVKIRGFGAISDEASRIAQQLITTIGTLVVTIVGFYFGTRAVAAARGVAVPSMPAIRSIKPNEGKQEDELSIEILGRNFLSPKIVKLVQGSSEMLCEGILSSATKISCKLKIGKADPIGKWDMVEVNEDGGEDRIAEAFEVKKKVQAPE